MNRSLIQMRRPATQAALGLILSAALFSIAPAQACPGGPGGHGGPGMDVGAQIETMTKQLALTEAQQQQVRAVLEKTREEQMRLRQQNRAQIDAILTDEQKAKRTERQAKAVNRQVERMTDRLDLSNEQADQLKILFTEQRQTHALSPAQMHDKLSAILSAEQLAEFEQGRGNGQRGGPGRGSCNY